MHPREQPDLGCGVTKGQQAALLQLRRVCADPRSPVRIVRVEEPSEATAELRIRITVDCRPYKTIEGGLKFRTREKFVLSVPPDFPFAIPFIDAAHSRFRGFPHIQWGSRLCLYLSYETQWIPSEGIFGFMAQLDRWLRRAARNELDDPEGPVHPPVAYIGSSYTIQLNADPPTGELWPWHGGALLRRLQTGLMVVDDWVASADPSESRIFAPTVLLNSQLPFEFPLTVYDLLRCLHDGEGKEQSLYVDLLFAAQHVTDGDPMFVGIGTPSRGRGEDNQQRFQHVQFWEIEQSNIKSLQNLWVALRKQRQFDDREIPPEIVSLVDSSWKDVFRWQRESLVKWCRVLENRPEIVIRRDKGTSMDWFRGKRVALWGCGALGSYIAEALVRSGVSTLKLYDDGLVTPGLLVRQNFVKDDINEYKTEALSSRLISISSDTHVVTNTGNLLNILEDECWDTDVDVIIDATASLRVRTKLEYLLKEHNAKVPLVSLMISADAQRAVAVLAPPGYGCGPLDVLRRLGLAATSKAELESWAEAFWTSEAAEFLRQPEPGCSSPTFVASYVDVASLAARTINAVAKALDENIESASGLLLQTAVEETGHCFRFEPSIQMTRDGVSFRLDQNAWRDIWGWIRQGARTRSAKYETGGFVFGEFDETLGIAWITNVSGPPSDSLFSAQEFVCGIHGIEELCEGYVSRTKGAVSYLGTWHSHPESAATPSAMDHDAIASIFASTPREGAHQLMMIVGNVLGEPLELGLYSFMRSGAITDEDVVASIDSLRGGKMNVGLPVRNGKTIGLALSGGGYRAVAFHLGTLRALEDLDLLRDVKVISGVSGGSLMTALFGFNQSEFKDVDLKTVRMLREGLVKSFLCKLLLSHRPVLLLWNSLVVAILRVISRFITWVIRWILGSLIDAKSAKRRSRKLTRALRARYSRTHVMADVIADVVGTQSCDAPTREGMSIVFNACELRTGTAFRMSNERFGSWRYGYAHSSELRVADAVAASAAYPPFLPPFDWVKTFQKNGESIKQRVVVTDGGVYENLGVSVMTPEVDGKNSSVQYEVDYLISSDAGAGQMSGRLIPIGWRSRMTQTVEAMMRKVQDATKKRLHELAASGQIEGFSYIGLGQFDDRVHPKTANWVDREDVIHYPTNINAMSDEDITKLSNRGESLTRSLVTRYLLSD